MDEYSRDNRNNVLRKIYELKHSKFRDIIIDGHCRNMPYSLLLITADRVVDQGIIELLAKWRKRHETWFPAQFKVTIEGTAQWLKNKVINEPDRLLFLIQIDGAYIGHIGLYRFEFEHRSCEIDNIVRGEPTLPGVMKMAINDMMMWGTENLNVQKYALQTFSDNDKSLKLYDRLGFREILRVPMHRTEGDDRIEWKECRENNSGTAERYNVYMVLQEFNKL
jgi:RimJ/RimL family protein N-acetyltransferase